MLNPTYTLPTRKSLSEGLLPQIYMRVKQNVKNDICKAQSVCLTTDSWISDNNKSFVALTAHYIDPDKGTFIYTRIIEFFHKSTEVTVEVSTEKSVSLSKVIVYCRLLMRQIRHHLTQATAVQNGKIHTLLHTLDEQLHRRFSSTESNSLYAESTILDPRFKNKGFRDENNFKRSLSALKQKVGYMRRTPAATESSEP